MYRHRFLVAERRAGRSNSVGRVEEECRRPIVVLMRWLGLSGRVGRQLGCFTEPCLLEEVTRLLPSPEASAAVSFQQLVLPPPYHNE